MKSKFRQLIKEWSDLGEEDLLWSVLSEEDKRNSKWKDEEFYLTGKNEVDRLLHTATQSNINIGRKALDFGCGVGRLTFALAEHFDEVIGVDISEVALDKANQVNTVPKKVRFIRNQTLDLKILESESVDFILSLITLQHNPRAITKVFLTEFSRVLKGNAILCFQLPSHRIDNGLKRWTSAMMPLPVKKWIFRYVFKKAEGLMEMHGWREVSLLNFMDSLGMDFILKQPDDRAGEAWVSYTYWFRKRKSG